MLSGLHVFCVAQEMRAAPMNFLNAQRTALLVEDYVKHGVVRSPPEVRVPKVSCIERVRPQSAVTPWSDDFSY